MMHQWFRCRLSRLAIAMLLGTLLETNDFLFRSTADAADITASWLDPNAQSIWEVNANWDSAVFPNNTPTTTYDAIIDVASGQSNLPFIGIGSSITIDNFLLDSPDASVRAQPSSVFSVLDTAELAAGNFDLGGGTLLGGTWLLNGGTLAFSNNGNNRLDGTQIQGDLNLTTTFGSRVRLLNGANFSGDASVGIAGRLSAETDLTLDQKDINLSGASFSSGFARFGVGGSSTLTLGSSTQVNMMPGSVITSDLAASGMGTIINRGTITASGSGVNRTIEPDVLINRGTIEATGNLTLNSNSDWSNRGTLRANSIVNINGPFAHIGPARLTGTSTVNIDEFINRGTVAPGNSPGRLRINGDYTQPSDGTLEIEVGGLTPALQHDELVVTGSTTLAGRLKVPIIDSFTPAVGDSITFLLTSSVSGTFDSVTSPNLMTANPSAAISVTYNADTVELEFVPVTTGNLFVSTSTTSEWTTATNWSVATPDNTDVTILDNQISENQTISVSSASGDVQVHELSLAGNAVDEMLIVNITDETTLAATTNVTLGTNSQLRLGASGSSTGDLAASKINIGASAIVDGNGALRGDVTLSSGATLSPGFSIGSIDVDGDYQQDAGSMLQLEVEGSGDNEFDTVVVTNQAQLDGDVEISLADLPNIQIGDSVEAITAEAIAGRFELVRTLNSQEAFFAPVYGEFSVSFFLAAEGDMNPFVFGIGEEDAAAFATALTNPDAYRNMFGISASEAGDIDDDGDIDFDDIDDFVALLPNMTMAQMMTIIQAAQQPVPEPASGTLVLFALYGLSLTGRRCGRSFRQSGD